MSASPVLFFFDVADPLSYALELELRSAAPGTAVAVVRVPLELRPPPLPLLDPADPAWADRLRRAAEPVAGHGAALSAPERLPWTRKAHELVLHARASGREDEVLLALYRALLEEGRDVGRVDALVALAVREGLDPTETKAILDVDKYAAEAAAGTAHAEAAGVTEPPALAADGHVLRGFHNRHAIGTFLESTRTRVR